MIVNSKNNLPLHNQNITKIIDGLIFNTAESELIGHKLTDDKGLTANAFYILYRSPGHRYFVYDHKNIPGTNPLIVKPEISLKPLTKAEAEELYEGLDDKQMTRAETFSQVVDA